MRARRYECAVHSGCQSRHSIYHARTDTAGWPLAFPDISKMPIKQLHLGQSRVDMAGF